MIMTNFGILKFSYIAFAELNSNPVALLTDACMQVISRGMKHRKMGSHELNLESSRSHSIMTVYIEAVATSPDDHDYGIPKFGKVSFVDLAGSERLKDTKSAGEMLKETSSINKSLFTLGKVQQWCY